MPSYLLRNHSPPKAPTKCEPLPSKIIFQLLIPNFSFVIFLIFNISFVVIYSKSFIQNRLYLMFYLNMAIYIVYLYKVMFGFQMFGRRMMQAAAKNYSMTNKYSFTQSLTWSNMYVLK